MNFFAVISYLPAEAQDKRFVSVCKLCTAWMSNNGSKLGSGTGKVLLKGNVLKAMGQEKPATREARKEQNWKIHPDFLCPNHGMFLLLSASWQARICSNVLWGRGLNSSEQAGFPKALLQTNSHDSLCSYYSGGREMKPGEISLLLSENSFLLCNATTTSLFLCSKVLRSENTNEHGKRPPSQKMLLGLIGHLTSRMVTETRRW